ncbi:MAG: NUDIX hydrolase [Chloroflexi bacterium]|nr:NUDIX hydrolase [Chloroflexota bacterium]
MPANFCSDCGTQVKTKTLDGRQRDVCPACGRVHYEVPNVGAGALIELDQKLLLVLRSIEPFAGQWNIPAGFVEVDESPAEGASREAQEETGLQVVAESLDDVYAFSDDPRGPGILIVYRCTVVGGQLSGSEEGRDVRYFSRKELPDERAGGGHDQAIAAWARRTRS